uniref:Uncharacterized protein n=1 Tax=Magallana gigas TaxID=29159 RepID=K1RAA8_MAGGI
MNSSLLLGIFAVCLIGGEIPRLPGLRAFTYRSPCVHCSLCTSFVFYIHSSFIVHKRSPNSIQRVVCSPFAQSALSVCSLFTHCSNGKVEHLRDCNHLAT